MKAQDLEEQTLRRMEKALVLWLNSSLGILLLVASRVPTEGAWVSFEKPTLEEVPVLDVLGRLKSDLVRLEGTFDEVSHLALKPLGQIVTDSVRVRIDGAFAELVGVPSLRAIAAMPGREPVLTDSSLSVEPEAVNRNKNN